jgi:hypothetical protein
LHGYDREGCTYMGSGYSNEMLDGEARLIGQKRKDAELELDDLPPLDNEAAWFVLEVELHLTTFQYTMLRDLKEFRGALLCRTVGLVLLTVTTCSSWPSQIVDNLPPEAVAVTHSSLQRTYPRPLLMYWSFCSAPLVVSGGQRRWQSSCCCDWGSYSCSRGVLLVIFVQCVTEKRCERFRVGLYYSNTSTKVPVEKRTRSLQSLV